jgi:hypothetical protein
VKDPRLKLEDSLKPYSTQDAIDLVIYNSGTPEYSAANDHLRKFASNILRGSQTQSGLTRMASPNLPLSPSTLNEQVVKASKVYFHPGLKHVKKTAAKSLKTV